MAVFKSGDQVWVFGRYRGVVVSFNKNQGEYYVAYRDRFAKKGWRCRYISETFLCRCSDKCHYEVVLGGIRPDAYGAYPYWL